MMMENILSTKNSAKSVNYANTFTRCQGFFFQILDGLPFSTLKILGESSAR